MVMLLPKLRRAAADGEVDVHVGAAVGASKGHHDARSIANHPGVCVGVRVANVSVHCEAMGGNKVGDAVARVGVGAGCIVVGIPGEVKQPTSQGQVIVCSRRLIGHQVIADGVQHVVDAYGEQASKVCGGMRARCAHT